MCYKLDIHYMMSSSYFLLCTVLVHIYISFIFSESRDKSALEFLQKHSLKKHQTLPKVTEKSQTLGKVTKKSQTTRSRVPVLSKPNDFELFAPDNLKPIKMTLEEETTVDKKRDITPHKRTSLTRELSTVKNHTQIQPASAPLTKTSCAVNRLTSECKTKVMSLLLYHMFVM